MKHAIFLLLLLFAIKNIEATKHKNRDIIQRKQPVQEKAVDWTDPFKATENNSNDSLWEGFYYSIEDDPNKKNVLEGIEQYREIRQNKHKRKCFFFYLLCKKKHK